MASPRPDPESPATLEADDVEETVVDTVTVVELPDAGAELPSLTADAPELLERSARLGDAPSDPPNV